MPNFVCSRFQTVRNTLVSLSSSLNVDTLADRVYTWVHLGTPGYTWVHLGTPGYTWWCFRSGPGEHHPDVADGNGEVRSADDWRRQSDTGTETTDRRAAAGGRTDPQGSEVVGVRSGGRTGPQGSGVTGSESRWED